MINQEDIPMLGKTITQVVRLVLTGVLEGKDHIYRGHVFKKGQLVFCPTQDKLAAMLNLCRGRLPIAEPEVLGGAEHAEVYLAFCKEAGVPVDKAGVHNLDKTADEVNLNKVTEDTDAELDAELQDLLAEQVSEGQGDVADLDDESKSEAVEGPAPEEVSEEVVRENQIRAALGQLDHNDPKQWTSTGLPKLDVVSSLLKGGEAVTRKELTELASDFKRNHPLS